MTPWHLDPLTAFDLESTDKVAQTARIVTGYVATFGPRRPGAHRDRQIGAKVLVDPGIPIPAEATGVHGITTEHARAHGSDPRDGVNAIAEAVARSLQARIPVVGHNLAYDFTLLYHECRRLGLATVAERLGWPPAAPVGPIIDTYVLDKHFDPWRRGSRRLDDSKGPGVATHYGVALGAAHTADADAEAAVKVAVRIAERFADHEDMTGDVIVLHRRQKHWRAEQSASLQQYFREQKGQPEAYVDPCWPLCTDPTHAAD